MRPYLAVLSARFRMTLQYRAAALAGAGTQLFWGLMRMMIFAAFYRAASADQPMSYLEVVDYVWLGQAMLQILPWSLDPEIRAMVRSGTVVYELLRPVDLYAFWYSRDVARRLANVAMRALPIFLVASLLFGLRPPPSWPAAGAWLLSLGAAFLLSSALATLVHVTLLWTLSGEGIAQILPTVTMVLSGMIVPLPLFPDWLQTAVRILPFGGVIDVPFRFYNGNLPVDYLPQALAYQLDWTLALVALGRWLLARASRRLVVQGG